MKHLDKRIEAKNIKPDSYISNTYVSVQILAETACHLKFTDTKTIAKERLSGNHFKTVIGDITFYRQDDRTHTKYEIFT